MAYGRARIKQLIWNSGGGDTVFDYNGGIRNGDDYSGGVLQAQSITGITGTFTVSVSGAEIQADNLNTTTLSGVSGIFTALASGATITGTSVEATNITGTTVSGVDLSGQTTTIGTVVSVTSITGTTFEATTADFGTVTAETGTFTTTLSGAFITGTSVRATAITGTSISGTTVSGPTANITVARVTGTLTAPTFEGTEGDITTITTETGTFSDLISGASFKADSNTTVITDAGNVKPFGLFSFPGNLGTSGATLISKGNGTTQWNAGSANYSVEVVTGAITGVAGTMYVMTTGTTITLPVTPATGDFLIIRNQSDSTTGVVDRNGSNIMGLAENVVINDLNFKTEFIFYGGTEGWVLL